MRKLKNEELLVLQGGESISVEEYCKLMVQIMGDMTQSSGAREGASIGYQKFCL